MTFCISQKTQKSLATLAYAVSTLQPSQEQGVVGTTTMSGGSQAVSDETIVEKHKVSVTQLTTKVFQRRSRIWEVYVFLNSQARKEITLWVSIFPRYFRKQDYAYSVSTKSDSILSTIGEVDFDVLSNSKSKKWHLIKCQTSFPITLILRVRTPCPHGNKTIAIQQKTDLYRKKVIL